MHWPGFYLLLSKRKTTTAFPQIHQLTDNSPSLSQLVSRIVRFISSETRFVLTTSQHKASTPAKAYAGTWMSRSLFIYPTSRAAMLGATAAILSLCDPLKLLPLVRRFVVFWLTEDRPDLNIVWSESIGTHWYLGFHISRQESRRGSCRESSMTLGSSSSPHFLDFVTDLLGIRSFTRVVQCVWHRQY